MEILKLGKSMKIETKRSKENRNQKDTVNIDLLVIKVNTKRQNSAV